MTQVVTEGCCGGHTRCPHPTAPAAGATGLPAQPGLSRVLRIHRQGGRRRSRHGTPPRQETPRLRIHRGMASLREPANLGRKSTRLNSSHQKISYAVFCLKKKKIRTEQYPKSKRPLLTSHMDNARANKIE